MSGAIVGPHGHGKTTLLSELQKRLQADQWDILRIKLDTSHPELTQQHWDSIHLAGSGQLRSILILDGAEQLTKRAWKQLLSSLPSEAGLLITSHDSGLLPTIFQSTSELFTFQQIVCFLLNVCEITELNEQWQVAVSAAYQKNAGDIRQALFQLYDDCAENRLIV